MQSIDSMIPVLLIFCIHMNSSYYCEHHCKFTGISPIIIASKCYNDFGKITYYAGIMHCHPIIIYAQNYAGILAQA